MVKLSLRPFIVLNSIVGIYLPRLVIESLFPIPHNWGSTIARVVSREMFSQDPLVGSGQRCVVWILVSSFIRYRTSTIPTGLSVMVEPFAAFVCLGLLGLYSAIYSTKVHYQ